MRRGYELGWLGRTARWMPEGYPSRQAPGWAVAVAEPESAKARLEDASQAYFVGGRKKMKTPRRCKEAPGTRMRRSLGSSEGHLQVPRRPSVDGISQLVSSVELLIVILVIFGLLSCVRKIKDKDIREKLAYTLSLKH